MVFKVEKKSFSTGDWLKLATKKIQEIKNKKKVPNFSRRNWFIF
jgi:tRNA dimethylallyltransferase